ncbi:MAG: cytidylate kinase-like family protein [Treponema sp.]|nr:cytidylate kinase-like family protein [Treponema sp.]
MAIITLSRQVGARGDEVALEIEKKLGYTFITRKDVEKRIVELGFPESKMPKYDERKPGFFASMAKDRDLYINLTHYAMLEAATKNNTIFIGRGSFALFHQYANNISARIVADEKTRIDRLMQEKDWSEKKALQRITESDANRLGFHKNFYNVDVSNPENYHLVVNTGVLSDLQCADLISSVVKSKITETEEKEGMKNIEIMFKIQGVVNKIFTEEQVNIEFMHANIEDGTIVLYGVCESIALVEKALNVFRRELPDYPVKSSVSLIHNYKSFQ